jgi:tyrosine-protein kinase Etk/Wzc
MKKEDLDFLSELEEDQKKEKKDFAEVLFKYIRYWRWFVVSMIVCLAGAIAYLKTTTPIYEVDAKILLKDDQKGGSSAADNLSTFQDLGLFNVKNNADNELEILKTSNLMERAVRKLGLYARYSETGSFRNADLYGKECPISVRLPETVLDTLHGTFNFQVEAQPNGTYTFTGNYKDKDYCVNASRIDSQVALPFGMIYITPGPYRPREIINIDVTLKSPSKMAKGLLSQVDMELTSKTTTVVNVTFKTSNLQKGTDFVKAFIDAYNEEDMKDRNLVAINTDAFLNQRLFSLGGNLTDVEKQVESFKQSEGLTDITSQSQLFIQQTGDFEKRRLDVETQLNIIKGLEAYINKRENRYQLLPAGTGVESSDLNDLIVEYNNLLLDRKRLSRTASENNRAMIDLNEQIKALFKTVQSSVNNEKRNLLISEQDLRQKESQNAGRIKSIPRQEREYTKISRQQGVQSQIYLYLLQKKEENALSMTTVIPKAKVIDQPSSSGVPVSPKQNLVLIIAFVLGLFLPVAGLYIRELFRYQIENKEELEKISDVPILGEIPKSEETSNVVIHEHSTDGFTEMFRLLRTNLMFVLNTSDKKVINVVSSIGGEGKTFMTINLAMSLALLHKKVLIVGLDMRKPKMGGYIGLDNKAGLSLYLSGYLDRSKLIQPSGIHPNLFAITSGPIPPNPNELLTEPTLDELIAEFREQFDYIVIDTAPAGAVSDCFLLNRFADINLYVVRADYTPIKNISDANDIFKKQRLNNMYFILNAEDMSKSSYTYRYGYRKKYSYGYGYGYGYYGSEHHKEKNKIKK